MCAETLFPNLSRFLPRQDGRSTHVLGYFCWSVKGREEEESQRDQLLVRLANLPRINKAEASRTTSATSTAAGKMCSDLVLLEAVTHSTALGFLLYLHLT